MSIKYTWAIADCLSHTTKYAQQIPVLEEKISIRSCDFQASLLPKYFFR